MKCISGIYIPECDRMLWTTTIYEIPECTRCTCPVSYIQECHRMPGTTIACGVSSGRPRAAIAEIYGRTGFAGFINVTHSGMR